MTQSAAANHPVHAAAEGGRFRQVRALLDAQPGVINHQDHLGATPLHRAVLGRSRRVASLLLDRGADLHCRYGAGRKSFTSYPPQHSEPIDIALWGGARWVHDPMWLNGLRWLRWCLIGRFRHRGPRPVDTSMARWLIARGAPYDLTIAAALGDLAYVTQILDANPERIQDARPNLRRPLTAAVEFGHGDIARLLLARGADPTWPDADDSDRGAALFHASRRGNRDLVAALLAHGADPNAHVDSAGNAVFVARTPEIRALLYAHGGKLDPYDLVWLNEDDEVLKQIAADPPSAYAGCGGVYTAVVTRGKRDLLSRLLDAGVKVPPTPNGCRDYLLEQPDMLRQLLDRGGLNPDYTDENGWTLLHALCHRDDRGRTVGDRTECASILLAAGATLSPRDNEHGLTPLALARRGNVQDMVEFLSARGAD